MTQNTEQDLGYYFKLGQEDYAHGFHEPFGGIASYLALSTDKEKQINEAYRKGWDSARSQSELNNPPTTIFM